MLLFSYHISSAHFITKSTSVERDAVDRNSADWAALDRFRDQIKKTLSKKTDKSRLQRQHGTPVGTPRSVIQSPGVTGALTPVAPSTVASIRQRIPESIAEHEIEDDVDVDETTASKSASKKRGRQLELHSESENEQEEPAPTTKRRTSGRKPASKRGKIVEEEKEYDSE